MVKVRALFTDPATVLIYQQALDSILSGLLPLSLNGQPGLSECWDEDVERWSCSLPLIVYSPMVPDGSTSLTLYCLWRHQPHAFRFVYDMVSRWLHPNQRTSISALFAVDFQLPDLTEDLYTLTQFSINLSAEEVPIIANSLPILVAELKLGIESSEQAWRILEIKGLHPTDKSELIHERIYQLIKRRPQDFDQGLIAEMQHLLVSCHENFLIARSSQHLGRLVAARYLLRRYLSEGVSKDPNQRYLKLKLYRTRLRTSVEWRHVLSIIVAINFLNDQEIFEDKHLLKALRSYLGNVSIVDGSLLINNRQQEKQCILYLEVEKESGELFSGQELKLLRSELPYDLKDRIEHLMHPVFISRNEEEILRNILNLSSQIKYSTDPLQAFIAFDEQMHDSLVFMVIIVGVVAPGEVTIQEKLLARANHFEYIQDRHRTLGMLRKKYAKEAYVFRLKFSKTPFIRSNGSIDLNKARQFVVDELVQGLGGFRDYNGGMISKQNELLCQLRVHLDQKVKYNELLLENFFYALMPVEMRTLLDVQLLEELFLLLLEVVDEGLFRTQETICKSKKAREHLFIIVSAPSAKGKKELMNLGQNLQWTSQTLAYSHVQVYEVPYFCYILKTLTEAKQELPASVRSLLAITD